MSVDIYCSVRLRAKENTAGVFRQSGRDSRQLYVCLKKRVLPLVTSFKSSLKRIECYMCAMQLFSLAFFVSSATCSVAWTRTRRASENLSERREKTKKVNSRNMKNYVCTGTLYIMDSFGGRHEMSL